MKTLIANLKHQASSCKDVRIGGGMFTRNELLAAIDRYEGLIEAAKKFASIDLLDTRMPQDFAVSVLRIRAAIELSEKS